MKQTTTRLLALLLALMLLAAIPMQALAAEATPAYSDVPFYSWYYDAVDLLTEFGVVNGVGGGKFDPNGTLTRAMAVTVLYRIAGAPDVSDCENPFTDVPAGSWYEAPVKWAFANQVTNGTSETVFSPQRPITREQLACFVVRYAESIQAEFLTDGIGVDYSEAIIRSELEPETSAYALDAMVTMVMEGLIQGDGDNFKPKSRATRAETAVVFCRFVRDLKRFPADKALLCGADCLEQQFDGAEAQPIQDRYMEAIWGALGKSKWEETDPVEFRVYYRLNYWGTEYQLAETAKEANVVKVILPDGTVHFMKYRTSHNEVEMIIRMIGNGMKAEQP